MAWIVLRRDAEKHRNQDIKHQPGQRVRWYRTVKYPGPGVYRKARAHISHEYGVDRLINWGLSHAIPHRPRVSAVSYLNTSPLVWGMLHGPQRDRFDLEFRLPSDCADQLASRAADIGIVPSFELTRQDLEIIPGAGIACHGAVRSLLLISSRPAGEIRSLALDSSSPSRYSLSASISSRPVSL